MHTKAMKMACPSVPVTSKDFHYVPAVKTDITETWRRFGWTPTERRGEIVKPVMGKTK